ncbi:hypothetical protein MPER_00585, partial [Moniliophthora perniciosa FA553]
MASRSTIPPSFNGSIIEFGPSNLNRTRRFEEFLNSESELYNYKDDIARMLRMDQNRLIVNIDDLRDYDRELADGLLKQPSDFVPPIEDALRTIIDNVQPAGKHDTENKTYH